MGGPLTSLAAELPAPSLTTLLGAPVAAAERTIEVPEALAGVLPDGGLRRGSTVSVETSAPGGTALALSLLAVATGAGAWCAAVGLPELGLLAASQLGVRLERLALVPDPGPDWAVVAGAVLEGADVVLLNPPARVAPVAARRLVARARERDAVLVVAGGRGWPEGTELRLGVTASAWTGLGRGEGYLAAREVEVTVSGRRAAARERRCRLLLPGAVAAGTGPVGPAGPSHLPSVGGPLPGPPPVPGPLASAEAGFVPFCVREPADSVGSGTQKRVAG